MGGGFGLVVAALAAQRAARAVTADSITAGFRERAHAWTMGDGLTHVQISRREWLAGDPSKGSAKVGLINCPHCIGFWLSIVTVAVWQRIPWLRWVVLGWAGAGAQTLLTSWQADLDNRVLVVEPVTVEPG